MDLLLQKELHPIQTKSTVNHQNHISLHLWASLFRFNCNLFTLIHPITNSGRTITPTASPVLDGLEIQNWVSSAYWWHQAPNQMTTVSNGLKKMLNNMRDKILSMLWGTSYSGDQVKKQECLRLPMRLEKPQRPLTGAQYWCKMKCTSVQCAVAARTFFGIPLVLRCYIAGPVLASGKCPSHEFLRLGSTWITGGTLCRTPLPPKTYESLEA